MSEKPGVKYYSLEEIKLNNSKEGMPCWIIYKNKVYDVTDYLKEVSQIEFLTKL